MGFAFNPNSSDHNAIDDTAERTRGNIKMPGGPSCKDTQGDHYYFPDDEISTSVPATLAETGRTTEVSGMELLVF